MRLATFSTFALVFAVAPLAVVACGSSSRSGFGDPGDDAGGSAPFGNLGGGEGGASPLDGSVPEISEVFGHSATTLYRLEPQSKVVTKVGDFDGCELVIDIALDESSAMFATAQGAFAHAAGLYAVDKTTAKCTLIKAGSYPNSLSFVPKGTLDPNEEALVGYLDATYVRIHPTTGQIATIGALGKPGFVSSGDVVSVKGGSTYLTITRKSGSETINGATCASTDCLVEIDPTTGGLLTEWGDVAYPAVYGLSFWGGKVYGFSKNKLFEVTFGASQVTTSLIPIPGAPSGLDFWGAGSSTSVPLVAPPQ